MNLHVQKPIGVKPFVCQICDKKFAQSSALVAHNKRHQTKAATRKTNNQSAP